MLSEAMGQLVERIYGAVGVPREWQNVLQGVAGITGARSGCILSAFGDGGRGNVGCFHEIDPEWIDAYNDWYYRYDPFPALLDTAPGAVHVDPVTGPRTTDIQGDARVFYHEVMVPQGFRHTLHMGLTGSGERAMGVILQRPASRGAYERGAAEALAFLGPHLRRALHLHARVQMAEGVGLGLSTVLDSSPMGVMLLDAKGGVIHANTRAREVLRETRALRASAQGLCPLHPADQRLLRARLAAVLGDQGLQGGAAMVVHGEGGETPLHLQITPISPETRGDPLMPEGVRAAVWLGNRPPERFSPGSLSRIYGLTAAEGELLADLVAGHTAQEIAGRRHASVHTVRTQVKTVMKKLDVSRQVDLIRIVLSGPPAI